METQAIERKTFKEVHAEIENEVLFLQKKHDIVDFKNKADYLYNVGFRNSIATKLYSQLSEMNRTIQGYQERYRGLYKFILEPQLERICEKYNLYVRNVDYFLGDIPEKNIKDIMNFKVDIRDLISDSRNLERWEKLNSVDLGINHSFIGSQYMVPADKLRNWGLSGTIQIAAIKNLFSEVAFKESIARIIRKEELPFKNQVELDPIVLCKTLHGYLIITAWGDEANDELVANPINN